MCLLAPNTKVIYACFTKLTRNCSESASIKGVSSRKSRAKFGPSVNQALSDFAAGQRLDVQAGTWLHPHHPQRKPVRQSVAPGGRMESTRNPQGGCTRKRPEARAPFFCARCWTDELQSSSKRGFRERVTCGQQSLYVRMLLDVEGSFQK